MREIKFRAWCVYCKKYVSCYEIKLYSDGAFNQCENHEVYTPTILEQYAGLKDKNGVEIYEGDIVKHNSRNQKNGIEVIFNIIEGAWMMKYLPQNNIVSILNGYECDELEVIGNIHQNPELLK